MSSTPMGCLVRAMRQSGIVRFLEHYARQFPNQHLKDLVVEEIQDSRQMRIRGQVVTNFGSDSFLGLDQEDRVKQAIRRGLDKWGCHNGSSRAFSSVQANIEAEDKLAEWLGIESTLIYPSVTLANLGAIPALVGKQDLLVVDQQAHNSIQEGARIASANGTRVSTFAHCNPAALEKLLEEAKPYRVGVVAIDGVFSMSGELPPLKELNEVCLRHNAILYVDDAHATAVYGPRGIGTVYPVLGSYDNTVIVGSLSKGFSCAGGFVGCSEELKLLLKMKSNTFIFGGPVVPPYLEAICEVCEILMSEEYDQLIDRLHQNLRRLRRGLEALGLIFSGGISPILSILVGGEEQTLEAGNILFENGFYVQSVTFPAVPYHAGVLRIQINSNHHARDIDGLVKAIEMLRNRGLLPMRKPMRAAA